MPNGYGRTKYRTRDFGVSAHQVPIPALVDLNSSPVGVDSAEQKNIPSLPDNDSYNRPRGGTRARGHAQNRYHCRSMHKNSYNSKVSVRGNQFGRERISTPDIEQVEIVTLPQSSNNENKAQFDEQDDSIDEIQSEINKLQNKLEAKKRAHEMSNQLRSGITRF